MFSRQNDVFEVVKMNDYRFLNVMPADKKSTKNPCIEFPCRGIYYGDRGEALHNLRMRSKAIREKAYLYLEREPYNEYDKNAILVMCGGSIKGEIGYVGKEYTREVRQIAENCESYLLEIARSKHTDETEELILRLQWIPKKQEIREEPKKEKRGFFARLFGR